ncbi:MAG: MarR family transcriptional regulator [Roseiflexaceae bacterium]
METERVYRMLQSIVIMLDDGDRRVLRAFDLTPTHYNALLLLDTTEGQRLIDLTEQMLCDKSTMTRIVDRLEQDGLAKRVGDPDDRRAQRVLLTPRGAELRDRAHEAHRRSLDDRFGLLDQAECQALDTLLGRLHGYLRDDLDQR